MVPGGFIRLHATVNFICEYNDYLPGEVKYELEIVGSCGAEAECFRAA